MRNFALAKKDSSLRDQNKSFLKVITQTSATLLPFRFWHHIIMAHNIRQKGATQRNPKTW